MSAKVVSEGVNKAFSFPRFPEDVVQGYRAAGLWGERTIAEEFRLVASTFPNHEAVVDRDRRLTYRELDDNSEAIAHGLYDAGLRQGDCVLLQVGNTVGTVEIFYGLIKAGLIPVCTLQAHGHHEIDTIAAEVGARAHVIDLSERTVERVRFATEVRERIPSITHLIQVSPGESALPGGDATLTIDELRGTIYREPMSESQVSVGPDDLAVIQLSGGTSGTPKMIPRLHAEYWYNGRATAERWEVTSRDRIAHVIPVVHNAGVHAALLPAHSTGAALVLDSLSRGLDVFDTLATEHVTGMLMSPTFLEGAKHPQLEKALSGLRWISMSGSAVPESMFNWLTDLGVTVGQNFGMTEGIVLATPLDAPDELRRHTVGFPISPYDEVKVVDPADPTTELPLGEPGELIARGPYTIRGYLNAPEHDAKMFTSDGFYRTGDVVAAVEIGGVRAYRVEGRIKDFIMRGGEKVNASEIEGLLLEHPRILAAAAVAMPDLRLGQRTCAFVVSVDGSDITLDEVRTHFANYEVAKFKWPERVENRAVLPRTGVGKIAKRVLVSEIEAAVQSEAVAQSEGVKSLAEADFTAPARPGQ